MMAADPFRGWVPFYVKGVSAEVEWGYMGGERFIEPFCIETMQKLVSRPFNQVFRRQSGLDLLLERERSHPGLPLKGMIFHMSRCGSTLASQWLAALPDSVVLSEPEPLGSLLQWSRPGGDEPVLRALLSAMGQPRRMSDRSLFLKTDCMHMLYIDRLLAAFPDTPWIFMYRDPLEVLVSHQRKPIWMQMLEPLMACGLQFPEEFSDDPEGSIAWMLSLVLQQAHQAALRHDNGLLLNYDDLPHALDVMAGHFGINVEAVDRGALNAVTGRNAKQRGAAFQPDSAGKRAAADERILRLAERWLDEPYRLLEQQRRGSVVTP